jgi:GNAT superfamily N-acetyltransferase
MSSPVIIEQVESKRGLTEFVKFPFALYRNDPNWVPPLIEERLAVFDPKKNPLFEHARCQVFLARRDGKLVGTISAMVNDRHNEVHNELMGSFGFFETIDDPEVAAALLLAAEGWVKVQGMIIMRGPLNLSMNDEVGTLIDGFDEPPMVMMTYNPRYYPGLIAASGYGKAMDLFAWVFDDMKEGLANAPEKLERVARKVMQKQGLHIRKVDMKNFDRDVALVKQVYNAAWQRNWGFTPMTDHEINHLAAGLKPVIDPNLVFIAETAEGKPVGVALSLPDLHQALKRSGGGHYFPFGLLKFMWHRRHINQARLLIMGMVEEYRGWGTDSVFYLETAREAVKRGYTRMEGSWILESNTMMNQIIERLGGRRYKTYRVYEKPL